MPKNSQWGQSKYDTMGQAMFEHTNLRMFATQATSDSYMDIDDVSVLDYINTTINSVTSLKHIIMYANQKAWKNQEFH